MVVNDNAGNLVPRVALEIFASRLAPTSDICSQVTHLRINICRDITSGDLPAFLCPKDHDPVRSGIRTLANVDSFRACSRAVSGLADAG
ncbi:hypothetical protein DKY63_23125 [Pseudomonas putida]|uniref:Uncharacterized protein n=1 Tax=Pseudomonas putida TaxID=303 RepID=A0A2Z4RNC8_PSEPU|nr:hypothetical protein DKY63_23125 [Pseudomonas putida]